MRGLVSLLVAGTILNLAVGWAGTPSIETLATSGLELPSPAPAWAVDGAKSCNVVVVVQNSCPFCQQAASTASAANAIVDRSTWVTTGAAEADSFRIAHPRLRVLERASAASEFAVQGVPAAFLVRGDSIVASWLLRGDESPDDLDQFGCGVQSQLVAGMK